MLIFMFFMMLLNFLASLILIIDLLLSFTSLAVSAFTPAPSLLDDLLCLFLDCIALLHFFVSYLLKWSYYFDDGLDFRFRRRLDLSSVDYRDLLVRFVRSTARGLLDSLYNVIA